MIRGRQAKRILAIEFLHPDPIIIAKGSSEGKRTMAKYVIEKSGDEWRKELSPDEFKVLREHATEPPGSSPLDKKYEAGTYVCAGCGTPLFSSDHKFDSGSGWPSFFRPIDAEAVGTSTDFKLFYPRTEIHCAKCGGHMGHVFKDGPQPTGQRYCINGTALKFKPK